MEKHRSVFVTVFACLAILLVGWSISRCAGVWGHITLRRIERLAQSNNSEALLKEMLQMHDYEQLVAAIKVLSQADTSAATDTLVAMARDSTLRGTRVGVAYYARNMSRENGLRVLAALEQDSNPALDAGIADSRRVLIEREGRTVATRPANP
jgi:hypothetical protein